MRIGSAGKTFSLTGWKFDYVTAGAELWQGVTPHLRHRRIEV